VAVVLVVVKVTVVSNLCAVVTSKKCTWLRLDHEIVFTQAQHVSCLWP